MSRCPTANRAWPPSRRAARESLGHTSPTECQRIGASAADAHLLLRTHHRCPVAYLAAVPLQVVPYFSLIQSQDAGDGAHQVASSAWLRPGEFISIARTGKPNSYGNSGQKRNCEEIRLLFHDAPSLYHHRTGVSSYLVERTQSAESSTERVLFVNDPLGSSNVAFCILRVPFLHMIIAACGHLGDPVSSALVRNWTGWLIRLAGSWNPQRRKTRADCRRVGRKSKPFSSQYPTTSFASGVMALFRS